MTLLTDGKIPPTLLLDKNVAGTTRPSVEDLVGLDAPILASSKDGDQHCPCCCPAVRVKVVCENDDVGMNTNAFAEIVDVSFNGGSVATPTGFSSVSGESCEQTAVSDTDSSGPCARLEERDRDVLRTVATRWVFHIDGWGYSWLEIGGNPVFTSYAGMMHNIRLLDDMPDWRGFSDAREREIYNEYISGYDGREVVDRGTYHTENETRRRQRPDGSWETYSVPVTVYDTHEYVMRYRPKAGVNFLRRFLDVCGLVADGFASRFTWQEGEEGEESTDLQVGNVTTELRTGLLMTRPDAYGQIHESFGAGHIGFQVLSFRVLAPVGKASLSVSCRSGAAHVTVNGTEYVVANGHLSYLDGLSVSTEAPASVVVPGPEWNVSIWIPPTTVFLD